MKAKNIKIVISRDVLISMFHECDKYDSHETGGRLIGFYNWDKKKLEIKLCAEIGPGPQAERSRTSFFQDGVYQEKIFREIESKHPNIEHLGNWHTHHVNGYPELSPGDINTYTNIVNHANHNIDFFYALLVVSRNQTNKNEFPYLIRHFIFFRGKNGFVEVPPQNITLSEEIPVWIGNNHPQKTIQQSPDVVNIARYVDQQNIKALYPNFKLLQSKKEQGLFWKGHLSVSPHTEIEVKIKEVPYQKEFTYKIEFIGNTLFDVDDLNFETATQALVFLERFLFLKLINI